MKLKCPACGSDRRSRIMSAGIHLKPYRVCPDCQSKYTVDPATKRRGLVIVLFAIATVGFSVLGFTRGSPWSLITFMCGTGLLVYLGYVLSNMTYVDYHD